MGMSSIPSNHLIVIPARHSSSRLPGKPLIDIDGKPMIVRTAQRCLEVASESQVIVATDDERIIDACQAFGIWAELTKAHHPTGTDRVAEIAKRHKAERYINVQGDEPLFNPSDILAIIRTESNSEVTYIGYCPLEKNMWDDSKHIKLVFGLENQLLYISRANIPGSHSGEFLEAFRQVCIYSYSEETLEKFSSTGGRTRLEQIEDNEVVRFLELGLQVEVVEMSDESVSVDRQEDVDLVLSRLSQMPD